jgi:hypothetical protein
MGSQAMSKSDLAKLEQTISHAQTAIGAELDALGIEVELLRYSGSLHPEADKSFRVRIVEALTARAPRNSHLK